MGICRIFFAFVMLSYAASAGAQTVLTLQDCRDLAVGNNKASRIAREKVDAAAYDRKAARANFFPKISVTGAYLRNGDNISLLNGSDAALLNGMGTAVGDKIGNIAAGMLTDPDFVRIMLTDPALQYLVKSLGALDLEGPLNSIGAGIVDRLNFDIRNMYVGLVSVQEPVYAGGKIRAYNKVADYAEQLASVQLEGEDIKVQVATDEAYWQIVSIAGKLSLASKYVELLEKLDHDVDVMQEEGVATMSDRLTVKVKLNEAQMTKTRAANGLALAKMLMCQLCGLELDSEIMLADENGDMISGAADRFEYTDDDVMNRRSELRSLGLAANMYDQKVRIVRSDYLPAVMLMGNYLVSNPGLKNGFENKFRGTWNVGVLATVPVFHFGEGINKVRKAKSDALVARYQLEDARGKVSLQTHQYEQRLSEAESRLEMAGCMMENADENLRMADLGFQEGVLAPSVVMEAQTAWLQARSEEIDAKIDLIMAGVYLRQATGMWNR